MCAKTLLAVTTSTGLNFFFISFAKITLKKLLKKKKFEFL